MLSVHYRFLTMTHQSKTENLDWYVMCYLEYCNYVQKANLELYSDIFFEVDKRPSLHRSYINNCPA